jgi:hypothetical protein
MMSDEEMSASVITVDQMSVIEIRVYYMSVCQMTENLNKINVTVCT